MPYYPPLYMPEKPEPVRGFVPRLVRFLLTDPNDSESHLHHQMKVRDPIPTDVWGDDDRAELGQRMASIIAERMPWPNDHFIPEDPFGLMTYVIGYDDLVLTEIAMAIEENLGIAFDEMEEELFSEWTFGEVVDYLRSHRTAFGPNNVDCRPLPLSGPSSIEAEICPKLAAFIEIRRLLNMHRARDETGRLALSTSVRALDEYAHRRLDWFVSKRYGTGVSPIRPYSPMRTAMQSATATTASCGIIGLFGVLIVLWNGGSVAEMFWISIGFAVIAGFTGTALMLLDALLVLGTRDYWRVRSRAFQRVKTVRDLVEWILAQREANRLNEYRV